MVVRLCVMETRRVYIKGSYQLLHSVVHGLRPVLHTTSTYTYDILVNPLRNEYGPF